MATTSRIPASQTLDRSGLAKFLRANRRALGLKFCEIWSRNSFDPSCESRPTEGIHTFISSLGKVFFAMTGGEPRGCSILDVRIFAEE